MADKIRIRMYRQGLGDCFLLTFYKGQKKNFHILIDCGVLSSSNERKELIRKVVANIKTETGGTATKKGRLNILVATHEHWDHLSGFDQAADLFDTINIDQIWMAWTEDPQNDLANEIRQKQREKIKALHLAHTKMAAYAASLPDGSAEKQFKTEYAGSLEAIMLFFGGPLAANGSVKTGNVFNNLKQRKDAKICYQYPGKEMLTVEGLEGIRFYVLGPPQSESALKKMNPSKRTPEVYTELAATTYGDSLLAALEARFNGNLGNNSGDAKTHQKIVANDVIAPDRDHHRPFDKAEGIDEKTAIHHRRYGHFFKQHYYNRDNEWRNIDNDWLNFAGNLALYLDNGVNNTSLALAIEFMETGKVLLFPADAQIGNWLSWEDYTWTLQNNGTTGEITISNLFERTVFYKTGHHGSHNATLREKGLEKMTNDALVAMIPVDKAMAETNDWHMPFEPLLKRLKEKTRGRVIIMDELFPSTGEQPKELSNSEWKHFKQNTKFDTKGLFVDFFISNK